MGDPPFMVEAREAITPSHTAGKEATILITEVDKEVLFPVIMVDKEVTSHVLTAATGARRPSINTTAARARMIVSTLLPRNPDDALYQDRCAPDTADMVLLSPALTTAVALAGTSAASTHASKNTSAKRLSLM